MASAQPTNTRKRPSAPTSDSNPPKRARHDDPSFHKLGPTKPEERAPTPINPLKRRIRSLTRLLSSPASTNLPATKRQEHERELASLKSELEEAEHVAARKEEERRRSKVIGKYHKVRFFERRKAERRLKQLRKRLNGDTDVGSDVEINGAEADSDLSTRDKRQMLHEKEVDVQYTLFYPLDEPYLSLFATEADDGTDSDNGPHEGNANAEATSKPKMWCLVEEAMEKGQQALQDLREGRWAGRYREEEISKAQVPAKKVTQAMKVKPTPKQKPSRKTPDSQVDGQAAYEARQKKSHQGPKGNTVRGADVPTTEAAVEIPVSAEPDLAVKAGNRRERRKLEREQAAKRKEHEDAKRKGERRATGEVDEDEDETGVGFFE